MKTTQIDEQMKQAEERAWRRDFEPYRQQQLAKFKQERARQEQGDVKASADMPRQPAENPS